MSVNKVFSPALLALSSLLPSQGGPPPTSPPRLPDGVTREQMWPAPTREDWARPVLIHFQRTWEDALAVASETKRAILVCVNMDGEIASEHYAGIRYRSPEIAALYEPYVCVIASVYRHNPRDYDDQGRRILCPRFGSVTCGEHIAIEPILYEKFMDGRRIAPRHIMVELDGTEKFDVYYAWDTDSVFRTIREGIDQREIRPKPIVRGDRSLVERVASRDAEDRSAVERGYLAADRQLRERLLRAAAKHPEAAPVDLLRLSVFGFDQDLSARARRILAETTAPEAAPLIGAALSVPLPEDERDRLIAALQRLGETSPEARTLAAVHRGISGRARAIDVGAWSEALAGSGTYAPAADSLALDAAIERAILIAKSRPDDPNAQVEKAEALLSLATDRQAGLALSSEPRIAHSFERLRYLDAKAAAEAALALAPDSWRAHAVEAVCCWHLGDRDGAWRHAERAVGGLPEKAGTYEAMAVLQLFAESRQESIARAWRQKRDWPSSWLTDVHAAYSVLLEHPFGTDQHVANHYDFLRFFRLGQASVVLEKGLARFPDSALLHARLRALVLADRGADDLRATYDRMIEKGDPTGNLEWFAGYASMVAAEFRRRAGRPEDAVADYENALAHYDRFAAVHVDLRASADHYAAMAIGGLARIALEQGELEKATGLVERSIARSRTAADSLDGLNISTVDTARMLRERLAAADRKALLHRVDAALQSLDPSQLELPAYEFEGRERPRPRRRGR
ncbi:MAG: hypothetical protein Fur0037_17120 [Planctomycetota bacterium]